MTRLRYLLPVFFGVAIVAACGSDASTFDDRPNNDGGNSDGSDLTGDNDGSGGGPTDGALNSETACASANGQAALEPLDMFIMFDSSISMAGAGDCNVGQSVSSPWCYAINALSAYLTSPSSSGNAAALQFFGHGGGAASNNACTTGAGFDVSVVPGGATGYKDLPSTDFNAALNAAAPNQFTPLEAAIRGITAFTGNGANRRAGRKTIGILITDANTPLDCSTNWSSMAGLLSTHLTNTGIPTYVIGMNGANFGNLETLAVAGGGAAHPDAVGSVTDSCGNGSGPCSHWNAGDGTSGAPLIEALKQIQGLAVGCSFGIPTPDGGTIDPNQVRVEYLPGGNPPGQDLPHVADSASCTGGGWYYDNNTTPQTVNLCGASCTTVQADPNAKLNVLFGCVKGVPGVK